MRVIEITITFAICATLCFSTQVARAPGDEKYFCSGECDIERTRCSCMKTCKSNKNCCTDYVESCETGGVSWTDTECTSAEDMICPEGFNNPVPLIILSLDGYRDIYLQRDLTPAISKIAECGVTAPYMMPVYPSKTFPNHYSIVTGLYPESHGIIANRMYDHEYEEEFRLGRESSFKPFWWHGEPIWVSASNQGLKSATYFWPGSDVNITRYPDYYFRYNESVDNEERVYQVLEWLDLPKEERPSIIAFYTHIVDSAGHTGGPFSALVNQTLPRADKMVEMLMNGLRDRGLESCVNFMITSDHGMASMDCETHAEFLEDYGVNMTEVYFDGGPYGRIGKSADKSLWDKFDAEEMKKKLECKDETHWETFLKYEYLPKRYHYANDPRIEDVHLVMDDEWWLLGEKPDGGAAGCSLGEHGFDNTYVDMRAFFAGHGSSLKRSYIRNTPFENIELYNLFAELLGIVPAGNNGTKGSLYDLMTSLPTFEGEGTGALPSNCPYSGDVSNNDLGCQTCDGISESDANAMLNLDDEKVNQYNSQHMPYGRPRLIEENVEFCVLTQRDYVTSYDNILKMPRIVSSLLQSGSSWEPAPEKCVRPDVRLSVGASTPCTDYENADDKLSWTFLYSPGLSTSATVTDATITSNMVPAYEAFIEIWEYMTKSFRNWANLYNGITVDLGPIFDYDYNGLADNEDVKTRNGTFTLDGDKDSTPIPTHFFIVMTRCKHYSGLTTITECSHNINDIEVLSFIIPNYKKRQCYKEGVTSEEWIPNLLLRHVSRVKDVELLSNISFFTNMVSGQTSTEKHLSALRTKLFLPQASDSWVQDFIAGVVPTTSPYQSTTSKGQNLMPRFGTLSACTLILINFSLANY